MSDGIPLARPASHDTKVGLVLQGGGALGSYQAGAYEALASSQYLPDWVAGISIGAINAAIITGNAPEHRGALGQVREGGMPVQGHPVRREIAAACAGRIRRANSRRLTR